MAFTPHVGSLQHVLMELSHHHHHQLILSMGVLKGLFAILVVYQWHTTGMSIADPLFKPVSGNALAFQMAGAMVLFCMTIFGVTFATGAANMLSEENCKSGWVM